MYHLRLEQKTAKYEELSVITCPYCLRVSTSTHARRHIHTHAHTFNSHKFRTQNQA